MSVERVTYLDSSAIVKLVVAEAESGGLRRSLSRSPACVASGLARTEVHRAVLGLSATVRRRVDEVLRGIDLIRVSDRVLIEAGKLIPPELRSLDAIHLATAQLLGESLTRFVTYDARQTTAARSLGIRVAAPA
jgi:predicted nucleic acid-binding protein